MMPKPTRLTATECAEVLRNWNTTATYLQDAPLERVRQLLAYELKNRCRKHIAVRLFVRANRLRSRAALEEFIAEHWGGR